MKLNKAYRAKIKFIDWLVPRLFILWMNTDLSRWRWVGNYMYHSKFNLCKITGTIEVDSKTYKVSLNVSLRDIT